MVAAVTAALRNALAPRGVLRAAINLSNFLLVSDRSGATPRGVSPSLCAALAARLDVPLQLVEYENPGLLADAAGHDEWDVGLIGAEPARAETIAFTQHYAEIEATYLVPGGSSLRCASDVDFPSSRVVVSKRAAYALWLEANLRNATLQPTAEPGLAASADLFLAAGRFDALAGLRPWLLGLVETDPRFAGARVLDGRFTTVNQAVGTPRRDGHEEAVPFLESFVADAVASGRVAELIREHGVEGKLRAAGLG